MFSKMCTRSRKKTNAMFWTQFHSILYIPQFQPTAAQPVMWLRQQQFRIPIFLPLFRYAIHPFLAHNTRYLSQTVLFFFWNFLNNPHRSFCASFKCLHSLFNLREFTCPRENAAMSNRCVKHSPWCLNLSLETFGSGSTLPWEWLP